MRVDQPKREQRVRGRQRHCLDLRRKKNAKRIVITGQPLDSNLAREMKSLNSNNNNVEAGKDKVDMSGMSRKSEQ